jgi:hypothetical protein
MTTTELNPYVDLPAPLQRTMTPAAQVGAELLQLIKTRIIHHPRSLQVAIGPSEIGHSCARRIGYKLAGVPEREGQLPNWKATVGTAVHTWMESMLDDDNLSYAERTGSGQERWFVETRVNVGDINGTDVEGSCDVFDRVTGTVVDWKTNGPAMLKKYKKGPSKEYRAQAHLYGRGWQRKGMTVRNVMIIFLPRNGELSEAVVWTEPYDEQIAVDALTRATGIAVLVDAFGDRAYNHLETADAYCTHCPFFRAGSTDLRAGCPGHPGGDQHRSSDQLLGLI